VSGLSESVSVSESESESESSCLYLESVQPSGAEHASITIDSIFYHFF